MQSAITEKPHLLSDKNAGLGSENSAQSRAIHENPD